MIFKLFFKIAMLILIYFSKLYQFKITCLCTTDDCVMQGKSTCSALTTCFVEYFQESTENPIKFHARGCISESNPLMCDQNLFSPTGNGPKLFLECCYETFCNSNARPNMKLLSNVISKNLIHKRMKSETISKSGLEDYSRAKSIETPSNLMITKQRFQYPLSLIIIIAAFCGILLMIILIVAIIKLILIYTHTDYLDNDQVYSVSLSGSSNDPENSVIATVDSRKAMFYSSSREKKTFYQKLISYFKFNQQPRVILT